MNDTPTIPRRLTTLGQALRPCLITLQRQIDEPVYPTTHIGDGVFWLQSSTNRLGELMGSLTRQFDQLSNDILANEQANDADVYRGAGRFEAFLDRLIDDRNSIHCASVPGEFIQARDLLAGAYRHSLGEIHDWLEQFIRVLDDPLAEARRRGLPIDGPIELKLTLTLTAPLEMVQLSACADRLRKKNSKSGFWTLVGGIALGSLLADGLFDNDCGGYGPDA